MRPKFYLMVDEERTYSFIFMPRICSGSWHGGANNVICCGSASCMASASTECGTDHRATMSPCA